MSWMKYSSRPHSTPGCSLWEPQETKREGVCLRRVPSVPRHSLSVPVGHEDSQVAWSQNSVPGQGDLEAGHLHPLLLPIQRPLLSQQAATEGTHLIQTMSCRIRVNGFQVFQGWSLV